MNRLLKSDRWPNNAAAEGSYLDAPITKEIYKDFDQKVAQERSECCHLKSRQRPVQGIKLL